MKMKKSVRIKEGQEEFEDVRDKQTLNRDLDVGRGGREERSLSKKRDYSAKHSQSRKSFGSQSRKSHEPLVYESPRRKLYEAKFEKFISNKENKVKVEKRLESM